MARDTSMVESKSASGWQRALYAAAVLLSLALVAQALYWFPQLPERLASHFDLESRPDGWMNRGSFLATDLALAVLVAGMFVGLALWLPRVPDRWINLPHKEHWLAPERRATTMAWIAQGMLALGCATQVLLLAVFHSVFEFNATQPSEGTAVSARLHLPLVPVAVCLGSIIVLAFWMAWRFRRPA